MTPGREMRVYAVPLVVVGVLLAGCGSGPSGNPGRGGGSFTWMEGGKTFVSSIADYTISATRDGLAFTLRILGIAPIGLTCELSGQFPAEVPPPAGSYPVVPILDGTTELPQTDNSFVASCTPRMMPAGGFVLDPGRSGQVVLTKSTAGDVEGSFAMEGALFPTVDSATTTFTGQFSVGCAAGTDAPCGPVSASSVGTCADFLACCGALDVSARDTCMYYYASVASNGDTACGRTLATAKAIICP